MKKNFYILTFLLFNYLLVFSQEGNHNKADEIAELTQKIASSEGVEKGKYYLQLSKIYWRNDTKKSINYGKKALQILQNGNDIIKADVYQNIAVAYFYAGKTDSTIYFAQKILQFDNTPEFLHQKGNANNLIGVAYKRLGDYDKALAYDKKALKIRTQLKDSVNIAGSLDNIASVYKDRGEYDKAIALSQKAADIYKAQNSIRDLAGVYYNIADLYMKLLQYDQAKNYYSLAMKTIGNTDFLTLTDIHNSIGTIYLYTKKLDSALYFFQKALKGYKKINIKEGIAIAYENLGETYIEKDNYTKGLKLLHKSLRIYKELEYPIDVLSVNEVLAKSYVRIQQKDSVVYFYKNTLKLARELKNPKFVIKSLDGLYQFHLQNKDTVSAFKYYNKLVRYKDSLQLADTKIKVKELEEKYQNEKKQQEIERLKHKQKLDKANFKTLLISAISLLFFILVGAYVLIQKRRKQKEIAELELEKSRIKRQSLTQELELKNKQLTTHALNMMHKNTLLSDFKNALTDLTKSVEGEAVQKLRTIKRKINHLLNSEKDWDTFKIYFEQVNKDFVANLKKINPHLTQTDLRLATLIRLNMTNKEIASILNITHQSVKNSQYRLKKKLKLSEEISLKDYLMKL